MAKHKQTSKANIGRSGGPSQIRAEDTTELPSSDTIPLKLQQQLLDVFERACNVRPGPELDLSLQEVKGHLYNRDFASAFGKAEYLDAYAARWSPSRALAYLQILQDISPIIVQSAAQSRPTDPGLPNGYTVSSATDAALVDQQPEDPSQASFDAEGYSFVDISVPTAAGNLPPAYDASDQAPAYENPPAYPANATTFSDTADRNGSALSIACFGGGAGAELVACAGWLRHQADQQIEEDESVVGEAPVDLESLRVHCVDIADWSVVLDKLDSAITTPPTLSKYASAAAKAANTPMLPAGAMQVEFCRQDLLEANVDALRSIVKGADVVTLMFTLNELYTTSVSKTQRLLFEMTVASRPGTLLLVVDSPGSYSSVTINGAEKKYPMQWLLDHTLLEASQNTRVLPRGKHWEKVLTDESKWFRLSKELKYPIDLENMRYQIHLYQRQQVYEQAG